MFKYEARENVVRDSRGMSIGWTDVYVYAADLYCEDCGRWIRKELGRKDASGGGDVYPDGPYPDGGGESDSPQHCGNDEKCLNAMMFDGVKVGVWLGNPLTTDGVEYLKEMLSNPNATPYQLALHEFWSDVYADYLEGWEPPVATVARPQLVLPGVREASKKGRFKPRPADREVTNLALLPNDLSARYVHDLQRHIGHRARIEVVSSETTMPRGWDYGNITHLEITGREPVPVTIVLHVAHDQVSGNVSIAPPGSVGITIGTARRSTAEDTIAYLMDEAGGYLSGMIPRSSGTEESRYVSAHHTVRESRGPKTPGVFEVPSTEHMLAMKVARFASETDRKDAEILLRRLLPRFSDVDNIWNFLGGFIPPAKRPQARYNLDTLWEMLDESP